MNKSICPLLFHHTAIRPNGQAYPCCYFRPNSIPNDLNISDKNFMLHPFLESVRADMIQGKLISGCSKCYIDEKATGTSIRLEVIKNIFNNNFVPPDTPVLKAIDLAFSNVCNYRCRMCGPDLSTNWYSDAKKLNIPIVSGIIDNSDFLDNMDFSQLVHVKIIGGEPMLEQEKFIKFLERCTRSQLTIVIVTNGSVTPSQQLTALLKECKEVECVVSIDAYGKLNDFLRKGCRWDTLVNNLIWYEQNFQNVMIRAIASIYNINCLEELPNFINHRFPKFKFNYAMIDGPPWMEMRNLPPAVKLLMLDKIEKTDNVHVQKVAKLIHQQVTCNGDFHSFLENDSKLNSLRNEHWSDLNSDLYRLLSPYI